jgi:glycosyltransferase involved in cell wall biosynthesis
MTHARFSIILPVHNGGEYVEECVNSILAQTFQDFDLLVIDNNSKDKAVSWFQSLSDARIKIFSYKQTVPIEQNWARIKEIPKNEFITLIGHDDILYPHYLEEMNNLIEKHPNASLYQAHYKYIDSNGNPLRPCLPMSEVQYSHEFLACHMTRTMESMGTGYMMRSKDYDELGGMPTNYPNLIFADYELWIRLTAINYKATTIKECFAYRIHQSVSKVTVGEDYINAFVQYVALLKNLKAQENFRQVIERYGKEFLLYYCQSLSHRLLRMPRNERKLNVKEFINDCREYAQWLIPGQEFEPLKKPLTKIAQQLDYSIFGREVFSLYQKIKRR